MTLKSQVKDFIMSRPVPTSGSMDALPISEYRKAFDLAIVEGNKSAKMLMTEIKMREIPSPFPNLKEAGIVMRIYEKNDSCNDTTIVLFAGTGFVHNNPEWNDQLHRQLAEKTGCKIVVIAGRVAPEYKFPTGLNDSYETFKWLIDNSKDFRINPSKIGVGGFSSGGNFAAILALRAVRDGIPLVFQILMSPFLDLSCSSVMYQQLANPELKDYLFGESVARWLVAQYLPDTVVNTDRLVSPYWETDFSGLPPSFVIAAEYEPLYEECEKYVEKLKQTGVQADFYLAEGQIHEYLGCNNGLLVPAEDDPLDKIAFFINDLALNNSTTLATSYYQRNKNVMFRQYEGLNITTISASTPTPTPND